MKALLSDAWYLCSVLFYSAGGLLIGQLDRVQFYESLPNNHYKPHILPLDGRFNIDWH